MSHFGYNILHQHTPMSTVYLLWAHFSSCTCGFNWKLYIAWWINERKAACRV